MIMGLFTFRSATTVFIATAMYIASPCHAQEFVRSAETGFSFPAPKDWSVVEAPGLKYKVALATPYKKFSPNIVVIDQTFDGTVEDYATQSIKTMPAQSPGSKFLNKTPFVTKDGTLGLKLAYKTVYNKDSLRQVFYLVPAKNKRMLVITLSSLWEQGLKYDAVTDAAMRNLVITK